jgi:hypothetical protein
LVVGRIEFSTFKPTNLKLKVVDQRCVKSLGLVNKVPITMNGITIEADFHILDISEARGGYPLILGCPWLKSIKAVNYWEKGNMKIGPHQHRVSIQVISNSADLGKVSSPPKETTDEEYDSWTSNCSSDDGDSSSNSDSETDLFALETLPQMVMESMKHLEDELTASAKIEETLKLIKFGPDLNDEEIEKL